MAISDWNTDYNNDYGPIAMGGGGSSETLLGLNRKSKEATWETLTAQDVVNVQATISGPPSMINK